MGERYSSRCFGQLAKLGQHRLQKEPRQNHSRYLPDRTQPLQGHATRYLIAIFLENCRGDFTHLLFQLGDHKKRAKYRFASKTLMRILPADMKNEVEDLINKKTMTLDLYEILGQCTWGQAKSL